MRRISALGHPLGLQGVFGSPPEFATPQFGQILHRRSGGAAHEARVALARTRHARNPPKITTTMDKIIEPCIVYTLALPPS
jgi:hypothetical protein